MDCHICSQISEKCAAQKADLPDLTSLTMEATAAEVEEKNSQEAYEKFNVDTWEKRAQEAKPVNVKSSERPIKRSVAAEKRRERGNWQYWRSKASKYSLTDVQKQPGAKVLEHRQPILKLQNLKQNTINQKVMRKPHPQT